MRKLILVSLILCIPLITQSQEPTPSPFVAGKNQQEHSRKTDNSANTYNRGTEKNPIFIKEISPKPSEEVRAAEAKDHDRKATYEWWTVISTIIIASFTVVMGIWSILLWRESKKTARFTGQTVETMKDTAERQLRAYVFSRSSNSSLMIDDTGKLTLTTIVKNFGQTPAHNLITCQIVGTYVLPITESNPLDKPSYAADVSKSCLAPGEITYIRSSPEITLNQNHISVIESGRGALFVIGEIKYDDVFGKQHRTRYCLISTADVFTRMGLSYYHQGNDAD